MDRQSGLLVRLATELRPASRLLGSALLLLSFPLVYDGFRRLDDLRDEGAEWIGAVGRLFRVHAVSSLLAGAGSSLPAPAIHSITLSFETSPFAIPMTSE